ncbi:MAG: SAM-dependent methyltransferase [Phycisphaeraceae bacterium]|nr:SAM-dependent methyltransferase [Phycisphaeraceae bacterium]
MPPDPDARVRAHYGSGDILERIRSALGAAGRSVGALSVDDLAPVDEFHTRGRESTVELAELAGLASDDVVIDVGCGLGGTARHLAARYGCRVTGIDLTAEYVEVGNRLTGWVGMHDRVELQHASALDLPFADASFDVAWTEHAQMNIADKRRFYAEIARVLKPGGRLLFHDIFRGPGKAPEYPAPWAEDESISALATEAEARSAIDQAGLALTDWIGKVAESIAFFETVAARIRTDGPPPLGIHLLMGDNAAVKLRNYVRNLSEARLIVALGTALKR